MRFLSWLDAVKTRITSSEGTTIRRRPAQGPVAGQLESLENRSLLSATALLINNELNVISDSNESIQIGSVGTGNSQRVQVLINGIVASTVASVPTSSVTSIVVQGGNLQNSIDLSKVGSATYPNLTEIKVDAGHGADTVLGSIDIDETINGNDGDDLITCQDGNSTVLGGDGNDTINGADGNDSLMGEDGNDSIDAGDGDDTVDGHDGNDVITAGAGNDNVTGGDGEDKIDGGSGDDTLNGMMGVDLIDGGDGNDVIFGGAGDDSLVGGIGNDSISGNDGSDTLDGSADDDTLDGGADGDSIVGGDGSDSLLGGIGNDSMQGNDGDDTLLGGSGKDFMEGNAGNDQLKGQSGNDTIFGGTGLDLIDGGVGNDLEDAGEAPVIAPPPAPLTARLFAIADNSTNAIVELDPVTGRQLNRFAAPEPINASGDALAYDGKSLFFLNGFGTNLLFELDPNTGVVLHATEIPRPSNQRYDGLAALDGKIYIQDSFNDDILVFDPTIDGVTNVIDINAVNPGTNKLGGLAGILNPDRLIATVAGGRSVVEINPVTGLITNTFTPTTPSAGSYAGVGVVDNLIFLGGSHVVGSSAFGSLTSLDLFNRSGQLQKSLTLPFAVSAFGGDDIGTLGSPITTPSQFNIVINLPAAVTTNERVDFDNAEAKWESVITGDLPDVVVSGMGTIDDLVVNVNVHPIDGIGGTMGQTVINVQRQDATMLPALATIEIDSADLAQLEASGQLEDTILHELGHALGFGTIWAQRGLLVGAGTTNPRFVGAQARAEYDSLFNTSEPSVPVENVGGSGSADAHWRESKFGNELMSSVLNTTGNPLSRVTIASMADLGYQVDFAQADQYTSPTLGSSTTTGNASILSSNGSNGTQQQGHWLLPKTTPKLVRPLPPVALSSPVNVTTSNTANATAAATAQPNTNITFDEITPRPVDGVTVKGALFDFKVAGVDSTDATFGSVNGPATGTTVGLASPVLEGTTSGVLTVDFSSPVTNLSFAVARNANSLVVNGAQVTLYDSSLNVISTSTVVLSSLQGTAEGSFAYTGTTEVSRIVMDFTIGALVADGDRFSIDNLAFDLSSVPGTNQIGGDTLIGGDGNDILIGREGNDLINGGAGNDTIDGGDGSDNIFGGTGNDSINGGAGNDTLRGSGGKDTVLGNAGNDLLIATITDGIDLLSGNEGSDTVELRGTTKQDLIEVGQSATKKLTVSSGSTLQTIESDVERVQVLGLGGNDRIVLHDLTGVAPTEVQLDGGNGNDKIIADAGAGIGSVRLLMLGAAGNDSLVGSDGGESLFGGDGNDTIIGNGGDDTINGGTGDDSMSGGAGNDVIDGGAGIATIDGGDGNDSLTGGLLNDVINGGSGNDTLIGLNGNDALNGMDGNDRLDGGSDNDSLLGGAGNDTLDGGTDNDTLDGQDGNDRIDGNHGNDIINGGNGDDTILGDDGNDTIFGDSGNDLITGGDGNDLVLGNDGDDILLGGDGNDTIRGAAGRDTLLGENGNDDVDGQGGSDTVAGNQGTDTVTGAAGEIKETFQLSPTILAKLV